MNNSPSPRCWVQLSPSGDLGWGRGVRAMTLHPPYCQGDEPGPGGPREAPCQAGGFTRAHVLALAVVSSPSLGFFFLWLIDDVQLSTNQGLQWNLWCEFVDHIS